MSARAASPLSDDGLVRLIDAYLTITNARVRVLWHQRNALTRRLTAADEVAELERIYALPSPALRVERRRDRPRVTRRARRRWWARVWPE